MFEGISKKILGALGRNPTPQNQFACSDCGYDLSGKLRSYEVAVDLFLIAWSQRFANLSEHDSYSILSGCCCSECGRGFHPPSRVKNFMAAWRDFCGEAQTDIDAGDVLGAVFNGLQKSDFRVAVQFDVEKFLCTLGSLVLLSRSTSDPSSLLFMNDMSSGFSTLGFEGLAHRQHQIIEAACNEHNLAVTELFGTRYQDVAVPRRDGAHEIGIARIKTK